MKEKRKERIDRGIKARSDDIFVLNSYREMLYVAVPPILPVVGLLVLPMVLPLYWQKVMLSTAVIALLAMSWDFLSSAGMVCLGQAFFFGVGAYIAGILDHYAGLPIWLTIPVATILGGAVCTFALLPVLRLRGVYFSMVTLVLPLMLARIIEATRVFGGTEGLTRLKPFPGPWVELYGIMFAAVCALFCFRRLMTTDYGLVLKAIRENDRSVMSAGINIYWFKAQALFITGSVGAFCGATLPTCTCSSACLCLRWIIPCCRWPPPLSEEWAPLPGLCWGHSYWCRYPKPCAPWEASGQFCTPCLWWYSSLPCQRAYSITAHASTSSSKDGRRSISR